MLSGQIAGKFYPQSWLLLSGQTADKCYLANIAFLHYRAAGTEIYLANMQKKEPPIFLKNN